jgi:hypothetical protein
MPAPDDNDDDASPPVIDIGDVDLGYEPNSAPFLDLGDVDLRGAVPTGTPYVPDEDRERMRGRIAMMLMALLFLLALSLVLVAVLLVRPFDKEAIALLVSGIFGPIVAIVGTMVGFYFGQQSRADAPRIV